MLFLCSVQQHKDSYTLYSKPNPGRAKIQAFSRPLFTAEIRARLQANLCGFCGKKKIDIGTRFYPSAYVFPYQYHSVDAPFSYPNCPPLTICT